MHVRRIRFTIQSLMFMAGLKFSATLTWSLLEQIEDGLSNLGTVNKLSWRPKGCVVTKTFVAANWSAVVEALAKLVGGQKGRHLRILVSHQCIHLRSKVRELNVVAGSVAIFTLTSPASTLLSFRRKHEWNKHGTCALKLNATHNEFMYFNSALKLQYRVNIDRCFGDRFLSFYLFIGRFSDNIVFRRVGLFIYLFIFFCLFVCL